MLKERYENIKFDNNDLRKKDYLDNLIYAVILEQKIEEYLVSDNKKPIYIALTGSWGSGKTTVARTAITMIKNKYEKRFRFFEFDAWKYEGDSFRRSFTNSILKQSGIPKNTAKYKEFYNRLYNDKNVEIESFSERIKQSHRTDTNLNTLKSWIVLVLLLLIVCVLAYLYPTQMAIIICTIPTIFYYFEGSKLFKANVTYSFDKLFSPEQFYNTVNEILEKVKEEYKLILIDNIDRCNDSDFVDTISSIKGFFNDEGKKIIYLIPFDINQFDSAFKKEYQSYSEKVFDATVDIKEKSVKNIIEFMDKLLKEYSEYVSLFTDEVVGIIANSDCKTPRQILNICNDYITEYNIFVLKNKLTVDMITDEDLSYLMKYTILKIEYKDFFHRIHIDSELIEKLEDYAKCRESYDAIIKKTEFYGWLTQKTYNFLLKNYAILPTNYSYFYESQNDNSFAISKELEEAILTRDFKYILENVENDKELISRIISYLKNSLIFDRKKNHWKTDIAPKLELIIQLLRREKLSIDEINEYFNTLLKNDKLFPMLIYNQIIDLDNILYFIKRYVSKYPKLNLFKQKLLAGLTENIFNNYPQNIKIVTAKIFNEISFDELNAEQTAYFENYISSIINNQEYKNEPYSLIFNSNNSIYISSSQYLNILANTNYNDLDIIEPLLISSKNKLLEEDNNKLFNDYISFINKISQYIKNNNTLILIIQILLELKDLTYWETGISNLKLNVTIEEECKDLYNNIFKILLLTDNFSLREVLLSLRNQNNIRLIIDLLKNTECPPHLEAFDKKLISRFSNDEFKTFIDYPISLYEKYEDYEKWLNQHLFSCRKDIILYFYGMLSNPDDRESLIEYTLEQNLSFEQKIEFSIFYETEITRYQQLLEKHVSILELCEIAKNTNALNYFKMCITKIIEVISTKENIIEAEMVQIFNLIDDKRITNNEKKEILIVIGINKTTNDNLLKIYQKVNYLGRVPKTIEDIRSYLIENGLIESKKHNIKNSKVRKKEKIE